MIFTDYYRFEKKSGQKSKKRVDCVKSTCSYEPFEGLRNKDGDLFVYLSENYTKAGVERKADLAMSKGDHLSSIYKYEIDSPYWFGDMKGTTDAFVIVDDDFEMIDGRVKDWSVLELFIARGYKNKISPLLNAVSGGEFDEEFERLRQGAKQLSLY